MTNDPEEKQPPAPQDEKPEVPSAPPNGEAAKPAAPAAPAAPAKPAAATPPKPPAPPPPPKEGPVALENDLVKRYRARFGASIPEAWVDRKQAILVVAADKL